MNSSALSNGAPSTPDNYHRQRKKPIEADAEPLSPLDSGYSSLSSSPKDLPLRFYDNITFDGPSSLSGSSESSGHQFLDVEDENSGPVKCRSSSAPTLPIRTPLGKTRPCLHQFQSSNSTPRDTRTSRGHARAPDRFIPVRHHDTPPTIRYRTTKLPQLLSPLERLLRHETATPDPFTSHPQVDTTGPQRRMPSEDQSQSAPRNPGECPFKPLTITMSLIFL